MIEIKNLSWKAGHRTILENINLLIEDNDFIAIVGPNGAGKSTLLKLILNMIPMQQGNILINNIQHNIYLKNHPIAYLPQKEEIDSGFPIKVIDLVLLGRMFYKKLIKRFTKEDYEIALKNIDLVGIIHLKDKYIGSLSGGEFQRMLLARALSTESTYIFLDEPEAGVDKTGVNNFFRLLKLLNQQGKTIITISHDLHMLSDYCTSLVCLNKTLHCHSQPKLLTAQELHNTFGENFHLINKEY
ncbi:MAG: metal ABC transporter ATP-binding protein [Bacilli bacterium]|nr:metal ABC transporter ATP-binding protein [Bacilli bacterium]